MTSPADGLIWARSPHPDGHPKVATIGLHVVDAVVVDAPRYAVGMAIVREDRPGTRGMLSSRAAGP